MTSSPRSSFARPTEYTNTSGTGYCLMIRSFSLEYWVDDGWYVGRLKEVPGVFSQGETLEELEANIRDAFDLMRGEEAEPPAPDVRTKEIAVDVLDAD